MAHFFEKYGVRRSARVTESATLERTLVRLRDGELKMTIILTPEVERLVRERVQRGEYDSADALVGEAVRRLIEEEKEEDSHRDETRVRVEAAETEIDRGEYVEYDADTVHELAKDVHERGLKKLAAEREKTGTRG